MLLLRRPGVRGGVGEESPGDGGLLVSGEVAGLPGEWRACYVGRSWSPPLVILDAALVRIPRMVLAVLVTVMLPVAPGMVCSDRKADAESCCAGSDCCCAEVVAASSCCESRAPGPAPASVLRDANCECGAHGPAAQSGSRTLPRMFAPTSAPMVPRSDVLMSGWVDRAAPCGLRPSPELPPPRGEPVFL